MSPKIYQVYINLSIWFTLIISLAVMLGWFFDVKDILSIIPGAPTMKLNTALSFFLAAAALKASQVQTKSSDILEVSFILIILIISGLTIFEELYKLPVDIDNFFIEDHYAEENPGRMSLGTSVNFFLIGLAMMLYRSDQKRRIIISQQLLFVVTTISVVSIISFILLIPSPDKSNFFKTMSIHTSILFLLLSAATILNRPKVGIAYFFLRKGYGSKLFRDILPLILLLPVILGYLFLYAIDKDIVDVSFGIVIYSVIFILLAISYISLIANGLNKNDEVRRALEITLEEKNEELQQFKTGLDQVAIVSITDDNGVIKYVNDNFVNISGYNQEELIGQRFSLLRSSYHSKTFYEQMWKTISLGEVWVGDIKNIAKNGREYWESTAIIPFMDGNNRVYEYLTIKQDITKRKEAESLLESQYVQQLEKNNRELEEFAYVASHDLQEPLRTISSFSELLYEDYYNELDETARKSFTFIKNSTERMSKLIKGLLDYSRLGKEYEKVELDTNSLVKDVINDLQTTIERKKAEIKVSYLPTVEGYKVPLQLLFQNLISNAIKFNTKDKVPTVNISARDIGDFWEFSVEDNGIGIEESQHDKIFAIFQRLHLKSEYEGTGIGLAHCKRVVEMHKGSIHVKSILKKGSNFIFRINKTI